MARTERDSDGQAAGTDAGGDSGSRSRSLEGRADRVRSTGTRDQPADGSDPALSVVVVTRNEGERVEACLDSILGACRAVPSFEVILVDSNSADRTVERASEYPITVLRIPSDELCTPAAGRYVGTRRAAAGRVLFVDGDMVLETDWLGRAIDALECDGVAAVDGWLNEPRADQVQAVESVRGVALYDAEALAAVGGFDPALASLEDIHLGFELTTAGYQLRRLPQVTAHHPTRPPVTEPFRRLRQGYARGLGQALRRSASSPSLLVRHLVRMRYRVAAWAWLALGGAVLRSRSRFVSWLVLSLLGLVGLAVRLGPLGAATFCLDKVLVSVGVIPGVRSDLPSRAEYPIQAVETVTEGPVHDATALHDGDET